MMQTCNRPIPIVLWPTVWLGIAIALGAHAYGQEPSLQCPIDSLHIQPVNLGGAFVASDYPTDQIWYDNFSSIDEPICGLRWWGFNLYSPDDVNLQPCTENPMTFDISFRQDAAGTPGTEVCSFTIEAVGNVAGQAAGWNVYQFEAILEACCELADGWVSIVGSGDPLCWFFWGTSMAGDTLGCVDRGSGIDCQAGEHYYDLSICLNGSSPPPPDGFDDPSQWAAFDPGSHGLGDDPDGYSDAVFDGRYIYFAPNYNGSQHHGEVLRYDTLGGFATESSWTVYDPGANGVGLHARGFWGAIFDGRYVILIPGQDETGVHGEFLRYDTTAAFSNVTSWEAYDPSSQGVGADPVGYEAGVFDGRHIYFTPMWNGSQFHGEVLRFDTSGDFSSAPSWSAYIPGTHGVGLHSEGYPGGLFDGRYVYFSPAQDDAGAHGEVLRYDTTLAFATESSWTAFDPGANGVGIDPDGYSGGVFDGRFVYFVPSWNGVSGHAEVLRHDTTGNFSDASSWISYNPRTAGVGASSNGFSGSVFDGRYIYFSPHSDPTPAEEDVLRYDTNDAFDDMSSWTAFDPAGAGVGGGSDGRSAVVIDARYIYFAPSNWHQQQHGEVLRYDTYVPDPISIEWVVVDNPGNAPDTRYQTPGYGAVEYTFNIGKYEVTNAQYVKFLNAVAAVGDPNGLYNTDMSGGWNDVGGISRTGSGTSADSWVYATRPNRGNRPVNYVSWYDALRFANWMHNGQPGLLPEGPVPQDENSTEDGAYDMSTGVSVVRNSGAQVFLPTEDEWYKAAYYKRGGTGAGYWDYPTESDTAPTGEAPPGTDLTSGSANHWNGGYVDTTYYTTIVGAYNTESPPGTYVSDSAYGTFDQGGNVWEWNETDIEGGGSIRGLRGGSHGHGDLDYLHAEHPLNIDPMIEDGNVGFRVAGVAQAIPTVSEWGLVVMALLLLSSGTIVVMHPRRRSHANVRSA